MKFLKPVIPIGYLQWINFIGPNREYIGVVWGNFWAKSKITFV